MPIVKIEYDEEVVSKEMITDLATAVREIVISETNINEVMVYANTSQIRIKVDPIEIFIEMTASKVNNREELINSIKEKLIVWKKENNVTTPFNLTLTPVDWNLAIGF